MDFGGLCTSADSSMHEPRPVLAAPSSSSAKKSLTHLLTVKLVDVYTHANPKKFRLIDKLPQVCRTPLPSLACLAFELVC